MSSDDLKPDDLLTAAAVCRQALTPTLEADWSVPAGDLAWDCRQTLDHIANVLAFYAGHLAVRATARLPALRNGDPDRAPAELLTVVEVAAAVLAAVTRAAAPGTRAFHPAGMADVSGFIAMGAEEILVHTADIMQGLGRPYRPPDDALTDRILRRLFPWAPAEGDSWAALRWAAGRAALPDRPRLDPDWWWHPAPLSEWDGTIKRRTAPPAWT